MKKKIGLVLLLTCFCLSLVGCQDKHDHVEIWNKSDWVFDDIGIDIKDGYFYDKHEKFTIDENTIGLTIYFSGSETDTWE